MSFGSTSRVGVKGVTFEGDKNSAFPAFSRRTRAVLDSARRARYAASSLSAGLVDDEDLSSAALPFCELFDGGIAATSSAAPPFSVFFEGAIPAPLSSVMPSCVV